MDDRSGMDGPQLLGDEVADLIHGLWRAVTKATRSSEHLPTLSEPHAVALRKLLALGPLTPAQLALEMHLARPTVSNLLRELTAQGLIERRQSKADGRSVTLVLTERAREVLSSFSRGRMDVVHLAMAQLSAQDAAPVVAALPSLRLLLKHLEAMAGPEPGGV